MEKPRDTDDAGAEKPRDTDDAGARQGRFRRTGTGARRQIIRRQNLIYAILMGTGLYFIVARTLGLADYLSHGIAFILVGGAGLIMSLTSMDIGEGLKDAVKEDGAQTRAAITELGKLMKKRDKRIVNQLVAMDKRMEERDKRTEERDKRIVNQLVAMDKRMEERDKRTEERDKRTEERDKRTEERLERMSTTVENISKDNQVFFKQMLEAQNLILKKVS